MEDVPEYAPGVKESKGSGCGCLIWGLIISLVLIVGSCAGLAFWLKSSLDVVVDKYADTAPANIVEVKVDPTTEQELLEKVQRFNEQLSAGTATGSLVLSSKELGIVAHQIVKNIPDLRGNVEIVGDELVGRLSLPLEKFYYPGKWLNGEVAFRVAVLDGSLILKISGAKTEKGAIPKEIMEEISKINFAENVTKNPEVSNFLGKIKELKVSRGTLAIIPK